MLLNQLTRQIENWKGDLQPFIVVPCSGETLSRAEVHGLIKRCQNIFSDLVSSTRDHRPSVGFYFEDPISYIVAILASRFVDVVVVPIPKEFTLTQVSSFTPHLDFVLTDSEEGHQKISTILKNKKDEVNTHHIAAGRKLWCIRLGVRPAGHCTDLPNETAAVIHTSGSTDNPKGVVISNQGLETVLASMLERVSHLGPIHYASVLPFSLLLEQILGIYLPALTNGVIAAIPKNIGCYLGTQSDLSSYLTTIRASSSNFTMLPPSFLSDLKKMIDRTGSSIQDILGANLLVATGGAPIDVSCLEYFRDKGLEVFQGYGLSENTSVVAWTYPHSNKLGSVGVPLKHNQVRISDDNEIEVSGDSVSLGYITNGQFVPRRDSWLKTGDTGHLDRQGCLHITGREANLLVLSSGRNVAPEWIEGKFKSLPGIKDIIVVGHGKPYVAGLLLVDKGYDCDLVLEAATKQANLIAHDLPDFAQVLAFRAVPFDDELYSVSGRILRNRALKKYINLIEEIYLAPPPGGAFECKTLSL